MNPSSFAAGTIVFDLDGVVYLDDAGIPGAADALTELESHGWQIVFATNNSTKTPEVVASQIKDRTGFAARPEQAVTSTMAAVAYAETRYATAIVVGPPALVQSVERAGIAIVTTEADAPECVIVGLDRGITYEAIDQASRSIRSGAAFIATNVDPTYPTPSGLSPGAGAIVASIATASGATPISCGKPNEVFAALVKERITATPVWVVGDRPDTDVALAINNEWASMLVLTGVVTDAALIPSGLTPDVVLRSIADVPAYLLSPDRGHNGR